jgi:hypothetical protein
MKFELVPTQWFDPAAIRLPSYKVGRVNYNQGRSYVRLLEDGTLEQPFRLYTSLTTAINSCAPMEQPLLEWYCKNGMAEAKRLLKLSQHYGTLMHMEIGQYLTLNYYDFDTIQERVSAYLSENNYWQPETDNWASDLKYDIAAFIAFAQEHEVVPMGIEYVLLSQKGFGTMIDLVCKLKIKVKGFHGEVYKTGLQKGDPKETTQVQEKTAIINFKSGKHGFYRSNGIQIECERQLWEENFPDVKIDCAMNWAPKDWITAPDWSLKDWTGEIDQKEVDAVLALAEIRYASKAINKKYLDIQGQAFSTRPVSDCIKKQTAEEYCQKKYTDLMGPVAIAEHDPEVNATIVQDENALNV